MAVASDDLPRFSLLCGAGGVYARPLTAQIESELLCCLSGSFTCETWLQIRPLKASTGESPMVDGCWLIHAPTWACGLTSDLQIVLYYDGNWRVAAIDSPRTLQARRWYHLAVASNAQFGSCDVIVDGEVVQTEEIAHSNRLRLPVAPTAGFRVGWSPVARSPCPLVVHEFRLWRVGLTEATIRSWMGSSATNEHPADRQLAANWTFSSGSIFSQEQDLSGHNRDLVVEEGSTSSWLRITPPRFHPTLETDVARLVAWQDTQDGPDHEQCRFIVEIQCQPASEDPSAPPLVLQDVTVVLVPNFLCHGSPNLSTPGTGLGIIASLIGFVRRLPSGFRLHLCGTAACVSGWEDASAVPLVMNKDGKIRSRKALEKLIIKKSISNGELTTAIVRCMGKVFAEGVHSDIDKEIRPRAVVVLVISDQPHDLSAKADIDAVEKLNGRYHSVEVHHVSVDSSRMSVAGNPASHNRGNSSHVTHYSSCGRDLEWVLGYVLHRIQRFVVVTAKLELQAVGEATFFLTDESQSVFHRFVEDGVSAYLSVSIGCCTYGERSSLVGIARLSSTSQAVVAVTLSYTSNNGRKHVARTLVRNCQDLTSHIQIERAECNKRLRITDDEALLLEQRRILMLKKSTFRGGFVSQEIAESENAFKKADTMKEELWARRKWIVGRGLRLLNESELRCLEEEALMARAAFAARTESLQAGFISTSREIGSRGASRGEKRSGAPVYRIQLREDARSQNVVTDTGEDDDGSEELGLQKISAQLNLQTKALLEHQAKMEDSFVSVRLAETKGPVIMNDTRRNWIVSYHDMMRVKQDVVSSTLKKEQIQQKMAFHEERLATRQEVNAEMQATNAALARFEKELTNRRKRAALSVKEAFGSVMDEFEASDRLEAARRDLFKCRLLKTLSITRDMFPSCVYVCFPIEISQAEVPSKRTSGELTNSLHAICSMLRSTCDTVTELPVCRRLSFSETFLWWGLEQLPFAQESVVLSSALDARREVQEKSWAVIVITWNTLFSSSLAWSDVRETLASARDQSKPVFHVQLETSHQSLEEFGSQWAYRRSPSQNGTTTPVEREFLMWRQNYASFQTLLRALKDLNEVKLARPLLVGCEHGQTSTLHEVASLNPCFRCLWPLLSSSRLSTTNEPLDPSASSQTELLHLAYRIGGWIDAATSSVQQSAPRSYHIDPNAHSCLSRTWQEQCQDNVRQLDGKWEEARTRRTKEIIRQIEKVFKIYEEEAHDLVTLHFKLFKRRHEVLTTMKEKLCILTDETNLLETRLKNFLHDDNNTDLSRERKECELMVAEELWQEVHQAELASVSLEGPEEQLDTPEFGVGYARKMLGSALTESSQAILRLGRTHIEDRFRADTRAFKKDQFLTQIEIKKKKCDEQRAQIARMTKVFEEAERILWSMRQQRDEFVAEDARAFFHSSFLEIRDPHSATTYEIDQDHLRQLAVDLNFHTNFAKEVASQALQVNLAWSVAEEYRSKVRDVMSEFYQYYDPSSTAVVDWLGLQGTVTGYLKEFCQVDPDAPARMWQSLAAMRELIDRLALRDRQIPRLCFQWKTRFVDILLDCHTQRWWTVAEEHLRHSRDRLEQTRSQQDKSFELRCTSEKQFQAAVLNRGAHSHKLTLLQRQLVEAKQFQHSLLQLLQLSRRSYETGATVMNGTLQNVKTDVMYKRWASVSEYHVGLIGELFDLRSLFSQQLDALESEMNECQQKLSSSDDLVTTTRQEWLRQSIGDNLVCATAEAQQALAHRTLELIMSLEQERVFLQLRVFDPKSLWLTDSTLSSWFNAHGNEQERVDATRKTGGATQPAVSQRGVDDLLVQLAIARLDVIKQAKWRDTLQRKLLVFECILHQQTELRLAVEKEAESYRNLGERLAQRVAFVREQYETSSKSEFLQHDLTTDTNKTSTIDRRGAEQAVRASRELLREMIASAQQDFLAIEATACQIAWRRQEHTACESRAKRAIDAIKAQHSNVDSYLHVLKTKDQELYELSNMYNDESSEKAGGGGTTVSSWSTHPMGMKLGVGRAVFEFYARDQWFRTCLSDMTSLGEKLKSTREVLASIKAIEQSTKEPKVELDADGDSNPIDEDGGEGDQQSILEQELQDAELALLFNRFESRQAEKTSENLREAITHHFQTGELGEEIRGGLDREGEKLKSGSIEDAFCERSLASRMFNVDLYVTERRGMLRLLRELATAFDLRDAAGNVSEVIFGASLDRSDLKGIFQIESRAHIEQQWGVALVVLCFARLFRRASLKKAAEQRRARAAELTKVMLQSIQTRQQPALDLLSRTPLCIVPQNTRTRELLESVRIESGGNDTSGVLVRVAAGVLSQRPLHRSLATLMPEAAKPVIELADALAEHRAMVEHQLPKPTKLSVFSKDRHSIKIEWKPTSEDRDLLYVAEISEYQQSPSTDPEQRRSWDQFLTTEKTSHTFHNLRPGRSYWVRVRSGFTRTRLGEPCFPILAATLE